MKNLRTYGHPPFHIAVIHGGPGAAGEMAPVARELSSPRGVLEPLQTAASLDGQVEELRTLLEKNATPPLTLIGFSWGAWLSFILAAKHPHLVGKLILVSSGPFEEKYVAAIHETRLARLNENDHSEVSSLRRAFENPAAENRNTAFARLGVLFSKADAFDPLPEAPEEIPCQPDIFQSVWKDAAALRSSGNLLALATQIRCPVVAIHGDYDPHPAEGVRIPLSAALKNFRFIPLAHCGHKPWIERRARAEFYATLKAELV